MAWTDDDYLRLGERMRATRRQMSFKTLKSFQDYLDAMEEGQVSGRTYADIEAGKLRTRSKFSAESYAFLEDVFGWFPGACRAVLDNRNVDVFSGIVIPGPAEPEEPVGPDEQDASYVSSQGATVESGITNEDLLREILRSRSDYDQLRAGQDQLAQGLRELSSRVERLESRS